MTLCIDGWDESRGVSFNKGRFSNDAIGWEGGKERWNAEFIVNDYDSRKIKLQYWCDPHHPVELMAIAIITYGLNIEKSTKAPGSHRAWWKLPAATLYRLWEIQKQQGSIAPPTPTTNTSILPTGPIEGPSVNELHITSKTILDEDDNTNETQQSTEDT